jgi:hypothetical protein
MWRWWISLPWNVWLDQTNKAVQTAAILIGGAWAYFKFVKGRIHFTRIEPAVTGRHTTKNGKRYLIADVHVKNIGSTKVEISQTGTVLYVFGAHALGDERIRWVRYRSLTILQAYQWLEPSESIDDAVLVPLHSDLLAVRLEMQLIANGLSWFAKAIVELPEDSPKVIIGEIHDLPPADIATR